MTRKLYKVRWYDPRTLETVASVDLRASHDTNAIRQADGAGRDLRVLSCHRAIYQGGRCVQYKTYP